MTSIATRVLAIFIALTVFRIWAEDGTPTLGDPVPGTHMYYEQNIRGHFAFDGGELIPLRESRLPGLPGVRPQPVARRPGGMTAFALRFDVRVLQVLSNRLVVVGQTVTNASGAVSFQRLAILSLTGERETIPGGQLRLMAMPDGAYKYASRAGKNGRLVAYREVSAPTFEEYLQVYERDKRAAADVQPLVPPPCPFVCVTNASGATLVRYAGAEADLVIPDTLKGSPVVGIGDYAFTGGVALARVTLPKSVSRVSALAFHECGGLTAFAVAVENPSFSASADGVLFDREKKRLVRYPEGKRDASYVVPEGVTVIGDRAFRGCTNLTEIALPKSLTTFDAFAFVHCSGLTTIDLPAGLTRVSWNAFDHCDRLSSIHVDGDNPDLFSDANGVVYSKDKTCLLRYPPDRRGEYAVSSVIKIASDAFRSATGLTGVKLPHGVVAVGGGAFRGCTNLISVTLPDSIASIGGSAFQDCRGLTEIAVPRGLDVIEGYTFAGCTGLRRVTISRGVTVVGGWAFVDCEKLNDVTLPDSVRRIDCSAFARCLALDRIELPDSVTDLSSWVFSGCAFTNFVFPRNRSLTTTGGATFQGCTNLVTVTIPETITNVGQQVFYGCTGLKGLTLPETVARLDYLAFGACGNLTNVHFMGNAPSYDGTAFSGAGQAVIYYEPSRTGWDGKAFAGRPLAAWGTNVLVSGSANRESL